MIKIKYFGYYDTNDNKSENRNHVLAATNKMTYICSALNDVGYCVEIISASQTLNNRCCKGKKANIGKDTELRLFSSLPWGNKLMRVLSRFWIRIQLISYVLCNVKKGEKVIVYHSLGYARLFSILKRIKQFKLLLEVEEVYTDVKHNAVGRYFEYRLFEQADEFIFPTMLLHEVLNHKQKPYIIIHGTYRVEEDRHCHFSDGRIHAVYAGTLAPRKGGAVAAAAAKYLDERYHIHILGFGSKKDVNDMERLVIEISEHTRCSVTYDGVLSGEDYIRFIQSCDIGLSTQSPDASFNDTSFPSKVLSYLTNGLKVVSIRIPAIEKSEVGKELFYYDTQTPQAIAQAILNAAASVENDSRSFIKKLDEKFRNDIKCLMEE